MPPGVSRALVVIDTRFVVLCGSRAIAVSPSDNAKKLTRGRTKFLESTNFRAVRAARSVEHHGDAASAAAAIHGTTTPFARRSPSAYDHDRRALRADISQCVSAAWLKRP